jgi:hypothetical protein
MPNWTQKSILSTAVTRNSTVRNYRSYFHSASCSRRSRIFDFQPRL